MALLSAFVLSMAAWRAQGSAFRGSSDVVSTGHMKVEELRAAMLDELMGALGHGNRVTEGRLEAIEEALRPMFRSLHKNQHGNLDHSGVRYALHRLFVMRHGMFIKGLEPGGAGWAGASPTEVLDDRVPAYVQSLFEQRLEGRGLGMHEIAILAATLEHLVHDEAVARLQAAYGAKEVPLKGVMSSERAEEVVDTYMVIFLLGVNTSTASPEAIRTHMNSIQAVYPSWPESQKFTREVQREVIKANAADAAFGHGILSFNATSRVVEEIMERYGRWQDSECRSLKSALMDLEDQGSGRVLLKDFYGSAKGGAWQFTESVAYLKDLGALDESSAMRRSVIIPNYINSHSNCLATTSIYSVCCLNECEPLLGHLEREVGAPDAAPDRLLELVANLPSATVKAPREIPADLRGLLEEVAKQHDGKVPLHGRLFGQWLHHAYPRECPYPHLAGRTRPLQAEDWMRVTGQAVSASPGAMAEHAGLRPLAASKKRGPLETAAWSYEEEIFVPTAAEEPEFLMMLHGTVYIAALAVVAFGFVLVKMARAGRKGEQAEKRRSQKRAPDPKMYEV